MTDEPSLVTCGIDVEKGFFWNPNFIKLLMPCQLRAVVEHERNHLEYMKPRMDPEVYKRSLEKLEEMAKWKP